MSLGDITVSSYIPYLITILSNERAGLLSIVEVFSISRIDSISIFCLTSTPDLIIRCVSVIVYLVLISMSVTSRHGITEVSSVSHVNGRKIRGEMNVRHATRNIRYTAMSVFYLNVHGVALI